jgi:hypothetical protein
LFTHEIQRSLSATDLENNGLIVRARRQTYIPIAVYKAFVKMALAVMPLDELARCGHLSAWIRDPAHSSDSLPMTPLLVLEQSTPSQLGVKPYPGLNICLLRRRDAVKDCPYMYFVVSLGDTCYQVLLPMPDADYHLMKQDVDLVFFPIPFDGKGPFSDSTRKLRDFQSDQATRDEEQKVVLSYLRMERVDSTNANDPTHD